jgi:hypothetical protein
LYRIEVYFVRTNISIGENLIDENSAEGGATTCTASTNMSQTLGCASYYSIESANPDLFGPGLDFTQRRLSKSWRLETQVPAKTNCPVFLLLTMGTAFRGVVHIRFLKGTASNTHCSRIYNWVDDRSRLHVGAAAKWDKHTTILTSAPFEPEAPPRPWHSKTALDYQLDASSAAAKV